MIGRRPDGQVALYRFFDESGGLLYVGIADDPIKRWNAHTERPWWPEVASYEVVYYPDRGAAAIAEQQAIAGEEPRYNIVFNSIPYRGNRFPAMNLHGLTRAHFGHEPFTLRDLEEQLGVPYGTAASYSPRLVEQGLFKDVGRRKVGARGSRRLFIALPAPETGDG